MTPHPGWINRRFSMPRPWEATDCEPFQEVPDLSRAHIRFAAEVALAALHGQLVPTFAHERAVDTLKVMAA